MPRPPDVAPPSRRSCGVVRLVVVASCLLAGTVWAQEAAPSAEVLQRYEQILARAPMAGPAFDRLFSAWQSSEGVEQLDARWAKLAADPGASAPTYTLLRGMLADRTGHDADARSLLEAFTAARPDDFHGWLALGDAAAHQGRWADAVAAFQKGLATKVAGDDRLTVFRKLGQAQQSNLDVTGALATWRQMVTEFPADRFAVEEAGNALLDGGQYDEARKTFQQLVDLAEVNSMEKVQALMHLADVDNRQGRAAEAVHGYETILPLTAEGSWLNRQLRAQIEQIFRRDNDLAGLASYYQRWTVDNPKDVDAFLLLAAVLGELSRNAEALDVLRKATVLAPDRHEVRQTFALLLVEAGQYDEAITVGKALTADDPTEPRYWDTLGEAYWRKTQPPTAASRQAAYDAWQNIAPASSKDVPSLLELAELYRQHHLGEEALTNYRRALTVTPEAVDIREKLAKLLVELKRRDEAWAVLVELVAGSRATPANYARLATLQQSFGRGDAAADAIHRGLELDPKNFELLNLEWNRLAAAQQWTAAVALYDRLTAAAGPSLTEQLEARQLQALAAAGQLDDTAARLQARVGGTPPLTETELRLLLRILVQRNDPATVPAFAEAHTRFPQSAGLIRLESELHSRQGDYDAAVQALQQLQSVDPSHQLETLAAIVRVRQDQGNFPEAMKAASEIITAAPASSVGYLLFADLAVAAGQPDAAVTRLLEAIRLSEKPNDIRQRLARLYLDLGQTAQARNLYDDAFTAAEDPNERLAIVRLMATAYDLDGRINELLSRFRAEQKLDDEGGRFGAYLAVIYEQMQDHASAQRELAKSLAARPRDTGLLRSLIALAEQDGDRTELLRYLVLLAALDPSDANQLALATEYATQGKSEDAWRVMQAATVAVMANPLAWQGLLNQITDSDYAAKARGLIEESVAAQGGSAFAARFALAQFELQAKNFDGARQTLEELVATPLPPAAVGSAPVAVAPVTLSPPIQSAANAIALANNLSSKLPTYNLPNSLVARVAQAQPLRTDALGALTATSRPGTRATGARATGARATGPASPPVATDAVTTRDRALVYLSALAVQQNKGDSFLADTQAHLAQWQWPPAERIVAYSLLQAREPLLAAIEEQSKTGSPDRELDELCFLQARLFLNSSDDLNRERLVQEASALNPQTLTQRDRALEVQERLRTRLAGDPRFLAQMHFETWYVDSVFYSLPPAQRRADAVPYLKLVDRHNPTELIGAIALCARLDDWAGVQSALTDLAAVPGITANAALRSQLLVLPLLLQQQLTNRNVSRVPADQLANLQLLQELANPGVPVSQLADLNAPPPMPPGLSASVLLLHALRLGYPAQPPGPAPTSATGTRYSPGTFPPIQSTLVPRELAAVWQALYAQATSDQDMLRTGVEIRPSNSPQVIGDPPKDLEAALDAEAKDLGDARRVYPGLLGIYLQWWQGQHTESIVAARALLEHEPSDDLRQLIATQLFIERDYDKAITVLEDVSARKGPDYLFAQMLLLHTAAAAKNTDAGRRAAQRLLAMPIPAVQAAVISADLRNLGMTDEATKITAATRSTRPRGTPTSTRSTAPRSGQSTNSGRGPGSGSVLPVGPSASIAPTTEQQMLSALTQAVADRDEGRVLTTARKILDLDPVPVLTSSAPSAAKNLRATAITALQLANRLEEYSAEMEKLARADPGSAAKVLRAAEAANALPDLVREASESRALLPGPHWLKLQRTGDQFAGFTSTNGIDWKTVPDFVTNVSLSRSLLAGLWVSAVDGKTAATAAFDHLTLTGAVVVPIPASTQSVLSPWQEADIGPMTKAGQAQLAPDTSALAVSSPLKDDSFSNQDAGHFVSQRLDGDGSIIVRLADGPAPPDGAEFGVMLSNDVRADSPAVRLSVNLARGLQWQVRRTAGDPWSVRKTFSEVTLPGWLRLARSGRRAVASYSADGQAWAEIFSREFASGADTQIGLISPSASDEGGAPIEFKWDHVSVSPDSSPAAPWQYHELGRATPLGQPQWTGSNSVSLTLSPDPGASSSLAQLPGNIVSTLVTDRSPRILAAFLHQPLTGDGAITAAGHGDLSGRTTGGGLALRASLNPTAPEVRLSFGPNSTLVLNHRSDGGGKAVEFLRQAAVLAAGNPDQLHYLLDLHLQAERLDEAAAFFADWMKADPGAAQPLIGDVLQSFERAGRLAGIMPILTAWTPAPVNPITGGQDPYNLLLQLGNWLAGRSHPAEAAQLLQKALATPSLVADNQAAILALQRVLLAQNQRDAASAALLQWFSPDPAAQPAGSPALLGLTVAHRPGRGSFFNQLNWDGQNFRSSPSLDLLDLTTDLGLAARVQALLQGQIAPRPVASDGALEPDRMTALYLAVLAHDPASLLELAPLLAGETNLKAPANFNFFVLLGQQLVAWPEERSAGLQLLHRLYVASPSGEHHDQLGMNVVSLAQTWADHTTARATLATLVTPPINSAAPLTQGAPTITFPGQLKLVQFTVHALLREGMFPEAAQLLHSYRTDPHLGGSGQFDSFTTQLDQLQSVLDFARGTTPPSALVYGLELAAGAPGSAQFFWELQGASSVSGSATGPVAPVWLEDNPNRPTTDRLELEAGPDENHLTPLTTLPAAATRGQLAVTLPPGTAAMRAKLLRPAAGSAPAMLIATGPVLPVGTGDNLLPPTGLKISSSWESIMRAAAVSSGGPVPGGSIVGLDGGSISGPGLFSDPIPLPGAAPGFVLSGWTSTTDGAFSLLKVRFLDGKGKTVGTSVIRLNQNEGWNALVQQFQRQLTGPAGGVIVLPATATMMQVAFVSEEKLNVAALSLRVLVAPVSPAHRLTQINLPSFGVPLVTNLVATARP